MLYRIYRPKTFSEVIGQEHVVKTLQGALAFNKVAHAYLFAGPRGTGKTTIARLLAKAVNCSNLLGSTGNLVLSGKKFTTDLSPITSEPCNQCDLCKSFNDATALDLIEIDAASNRGIDEIRNLRESVRFAANAGKFKVYIIDEVHMLTKEAFNALLKTLEEPPSHIIFILATTDSERVPETIRSRSQFFRFKQIAAKTMLPRLTSIAESEKINITPEAIYLLAKSGNGSSRDAESNFTKLISFVGNNVTVEDVQEVLGLVPFHYIADFVTLIGLKKRNEAINYIDKVFKSGVEMDQFLNSVIEFFRLMLVAKFSPASLASYQDELPSEQIKLISSHTAYFEPAQIQSALKSFLSAGQYLKISPIPQLPLEIAIVELLQ